MTRWAIVADLNRCVGCQTCTAACKHTNATQRDVQWRKVIDFEVGSFPDVSRAFVPVGCMHCENPSCMEVCPTTATRKREDGIVTIDYDICIGCGYCMIACPYQARFRVDAPKPAYGEGRQMKHEALKADPSMLGVAQKCTFCVDRIDAGLAADLTPGVDEMATPACVASCISGALQMGDLDDPKSNVSELLQTHAHSRMHEELGNGPGIYYLHDTDKAAPDASERPPMVAEPVGLSAVSPKLQHHWDWRAASNFILGGTGAGLFIATALAGLSGPVFWSLIFLALALVALGLTCVWAEIGKPMRFLNVYLNPFSSWMSREAILALPFFGIGGLAWLSGVSSVGPAATLGLLAIPFALAFVYAQGRILRASKAIPAWRQPEIVALTVATGLTEGLSLFAVLGIVLGGLPNWLAPALVLFIALRFIAWQRYRSALGREGAPTKAFVAFDAAPALTFEPQVALLALALAASIIAPGSGVQTVLLVLAGLGALATGWIFKFTLITKAAFNQGYAINRLPARGAGESRTGIQPGWTKT